MNKPKAVPSYPNAPSQSQPKSQSACDPPSSTSLSGDSTTMTQLESLELESTIHFWGGPLTWRALQAIYTLAFICLLWSDEVLKIRRDHIKFVKEDDEIQYMVLTLPFWKTHQDGRMFFHFF